MIEYGMIILIHAVVAGRILNDGKGSIPPKFSRFNRFGAIKSVSRYD